MNAQLKMSLSVVAGLFAFMLVGSSADPAKAQCCAPPPPPCCTPPSPPTPPSTPCCLPPGHNINVPGVNVNVAATVIVNANANVSAVAGAQGSSMVFVGGGGGGGGFVGPGPQGMLQNLNVVGGKSMKRTAYEASREKRIRIVIQAFCLDDRSVPHPASQVSPDRNIENDYEGELYRCLAGTRMQYVWSEYIDKINFDGGKTVTCEKNQALWHEKGGRIACKAQTPARDCNERSLLRRFGAGVKILEIFTKETYTAYKEEMVQEAMTSSSMSLDGGVGGIAY
jgi:hypothetical protein